MRTEHRAPASLNGSTLRAELAAAGIIVPDVEGAFSVSDDTLTVEHNGEAAAVDAVIAAHQGGVSPQVVNRLSIGDKIATIDMPAEEAIVGTAALNIAGTTVAEVRSSTQTAVRDLQRQVKDLARANRRLSRLLLQMLDGTD